MSLLFYGVCILGVVAGVVVLVVLYSLLGMAQRGDDCLDRLELEMTKKYNATSRRTKSEELENLGVPAASDLSHGSIH